MAVRLPSLLGGVACLLAIAWLARLGYGREGADLGLVAALALAGCSYFVHAARIGLLDTGAALDVTLAVAGCQLARRDGRWWWFVGALCVLGAWQKAPFAFAAWGIVLLVRWANGGFSSVRRVTGPAQLAAALAPSLVVASLWWVLQACRFGFGALHDAASWQTQALAVVHDPGDAGFRPWVYWFWMARDWALIGLCAPLMVIGALRGRGRRSDEQTPTTFTAEMAWICAVFAVVLVLVPYRAERYLVVFTPLLSLLVVRKLSSTAARFQNTVVRRFLVPVALASTLPVAIFFHYLGTKPVKDDLLAVSREFGRTLKLGEMPVLSANADPDFEVLGFVEFYGGLTRPLRELAPAELRSLPAPLRGICRRRQWPELSRADPYLHQVFEDGDWIVWLQAG